MIKHCSYINITTQYKNSLGNLLAIFGWNHYWIPYYRKWYARIFAFQIVFFFVILFFFQHSFLCYNSIAFYCGFVICVQFHRHYYDYFLRVFSLHCSLCHVFVCVYLFFFFVALFNISMKIRTNYFQFELNTAIALRSMWCMRAFAYA